MNGMMPVMLENVTYERQFRTAWKAAQEEVSLKSRIRAEIAHLEWHPKEKGVLQINQA